MGTLRVLLALAVVVGHSPYGALPGFDFLPGPTAVQAFFIISGFFITMVLNENATYRSIRTFYASRYLRLYPVYIACALTTLLLNRYDAFAFQNYPLSYSAYFAPLALRDQVFIVFSNLTIFFQDWFLFLQVNWQTLTLEFTKQFQSGTKPPFYSFLWVQPAWSLGIEVVFYTIAPFVVRSPRRILAMVLLGASCRYGSYLYIGKVADPWYYRFAPSELALFALGGLAYHVWHSADPGSRRMRIIGVAAMCVLITTTAFHRSLWQPGVIVPLMIVNPIFLGIVVTFIAPIFVVTRVNSLDRLLGELSYPMYLCHIAVGAALSMWFPVGAPALRWTYVALVFAASAALLAVVDLPVTRLRARHFGAKSPIPITALARKG